MILTKENYHSIEADRHYMSNSQYKNFLECEAKAMAKLDGWKEPESDALLLGSYVHAYFEGPEALEDFKATTKGLFVTKGDRKGEILAKFQFADAMIETLKNDALCQFVMRGEKEVILSAEFAGVPWKIKIDHYNPDSNRFADIKTTADIRKEIWDPQNGYVTFVEAYGYVTQMALYAEIERIATGRDGWIEPIIVAVSKQDPPDKEVIGFKAYDIEVALEEVKRNMPRILEVKAGAEPNRCEKCRYCRETKQLSKFTYYADITA